MSPARWRLFVAAPLPAEAAAELWQCLASLRARHPTARWMPAQHYHATLAFLGATDPSLVPGIGAAVARAAAGHAAFDALTGEGSGRAGGRRGGVAWLQVSDGAAALEELSLVVDAEIGSGLYGVATPTRPHVTVARRVDEALLADLRTAARDLRIAWRVERLVLLRSHLGPRVSTYEELSVAELTCRTPTTGERLQRVNAYNG